MFIHAPGDVVHDRERPSKPGMVFMGNRRVLEKRAEQHAVARHTLYNIQELGFQAQGHTVRGFVIIVLVGMSEKDTESVVRPSFGLDTLHGMRKVLHKQGIHLEKGENRDEEIANRIVRRVPFRHLHRRLIGEQAHGVANALFQTEEQLLAQLEYVVKISKNSIDGAAREDGMRVLQRHEQRGIVQLVDVHQHAHVRLLCLIHLDRQVLALADLVVRHRGR